MTLATSVALMRVMSSLLFEVKPVDPVTLRRGFGGPYRGCRARGLCAGAAGGDGGSGGSAASRMGGRWTNAGADFVLICFAMEAGRLLAKFEPEPARRPAAANNGWPHRHYPNR